MMEAFPRFDLAGRAALVTGAARAFRRALPLQMDMTRIPEIWRAVDDTVAHFGRLDTLVNNADVIERIAALHRIGEPMDVAGAVVFLASPAASLITGHTLLIDGGWTAR